MTDRTHSSFLQMFIIGLGALGLAFMIGGGWMLYSGREKTTVEIIPAEERQISIWVDVSGAVANPGVYELFLGARLSEVLAQAGGLSAEADREWVARNLNLAQKATDGLKLYIPSVTEQVAGAQNSLIDLNRASKEVLLSLPGIGEARATALLNRRPFVTWAEVEEVLPVNVCTEIKPLVRL